jgi:hypothetical protein
MSELGWMGIRVRGLFLGGYREQVPVRRYCCYGQSSRLLQSLQL